MRWLLLGAMVALVVFVAIQGALSANDDDRAFLDATEHLGGTEASRLDAGKVVCQYIHEGVEQYGEHPAISKAQLNDMQVQAGGSWESSAEFVGLAVTHMCPEFDR